MHSYWWTESKWYGGKVFDEPIIKSYNSGKYNQFSFSISVAKVYYVGTWDFSSIEVSFRNEKSVFDSFFKTKYKQLELEIADIAIPE